MKLNLSQNSANCLGGGGRLKALPKKPLISFICAAFICTGLSAADTPINLKDETVNSQISYTAKKGSKAVDWKGETVMLPSSNINGNVEIVNGGKVSIAIDKEIPSVKIDEKTKEPFETFHILSLGKEKATNLTINGGGVLELGHGAMLNIGEYFDENKNDSVTANRSTLKVTGKNSKITGDDFKGAIYIANGELQILDSATADNIRFVGIGSDMNNLNTKVLLDKGTLIAGALDFGNANAVLEAKNGSIIKTKDIYTEDKSGKNQINLDNSTFEYDHFAISNISINAKNGSILDLKKSLFLDTNSKINLENSTMIVDGFISKKKMTDALNLKVTNSTLKFTSPNKQNKSLFITTANDTLEIDNATFEIADRKIFTLKRDPKHPAPSIKITGKNFIKAGKGSLSIESGEKAWTGTEVKEGRLIFYGDLNLGQNDNLSIKNKALAVVSGNFDLGQNSLNIGVSKENGEIQTGKLIVTKDADFSKGELFIDAKDAQNLFAKNDEIKGFIEVKGNTKDFKSANTNMALFDVEKLEEFNKGLKLKAKEKPKVDETTKFSPLLIPMADAINLITKDRNALNKMPEFLAVNTKDATKQLSELQPLLSGEGAKIITDAARNQRNALDLNSGRIYDKDTNLWGKFIGNWENKNSLNSGEMGYKGNHYGAIIGFDRNLNDILNMGIAFAYTNSDIDSKSDIKNNLKADTYQVMLHGDAQAFKNSKFDFLVSGGVAKNDGKREVSLANETFKSKYDSKFFAAALGYGYNIDMSSKFMLTPYLKADYSYVKNDGYTEKGNSNLRLIVDSSDYSSLLLQAGLKGELKANDKIKLFGKIGIGVETLDDKSNLNAAFAGANNYKFNLKADSKGKTAGLLNLGLAFTPNDKFELSAIYGGDFRDKYNNQAFNLGINYKF